MKNKGFTLIELLVVIAIIVILATLAMTSYRTANVRARDARRAADMEQVRSALELYRSDTSLNGDYPNGGSIPSTCAVLGDPSSTGFGEMIQILFNEDYWPVATHDGDPTTFEYEYCSDGASYLLEFWSESESQPELLYSP
jgi:prepilin-type N-terminal cleavage/methylation domain-containing protein